MRGTWRGWLLLAGASLIACGRAAAAEQVAAEPALADLPVIEVPSASGAHGDVLAVVVSGAGGWAALDREVAATLSAAGVAVVGFDCASYLHTRRLPDEAGQALALVTRHYLDTWKRDKLLLIGYSLGADLLPFMASRLPAELRDRVRLIALIGPSGTCDLEFHFTDFLRFSPRPGGLPVAPEVLKLANTNLLCLYGDSESDSACPALASASVQAVRMPGGHHFDGDYAGIGRRILQALPKRTVPASGT